MKIESNIIYNRKFIIKNKLKCGIAMKKNKSKILKKQACKNYDTDKR